MLYNGENNGNIFLSVRKAGERLGCAPGTAGKAFANLKDKGFIKAKGGGSFDYKARHATSWILTEEPYNNTLATKDFMSWPKERIVSKADTAKTKSRYQKLTQPVSKIDTGVSKIDTGAPPSVSKIGTETPQNTPNAVSKIDTHIIYQGQAGGDGCFTDPANPLLRTPLMRGAYQDDPDAMSECILGQNKAVPTPAGRGDGDPKHIAIAQPSDMLSNEGV